MKTDARKYEELSKHGYRFAPYIIEQDDLRRMHGSNVKISLENIKNCTVFFKLLLEKL